MLIRLRDSVLECAQSSAALAQPPVEIPTRVTSPIISGPFPLSPREAKIAWEAVLGICRGGKRPQGRASGRERVNAGVRGNARNLLIAKTTNNFRMHGQGGEGRSE